MKRQYTPTFFQQLQYENPDQFNEEVEIQQPIWPNLDDQNLLQQDQANNQQQIIDQPEKIEQHSPVQQQQQIQQNNQNYQQIYPKSYNLLKRVGKTFEDLIKNDIDPSVFEDLNEDMMMEVILAIPHEIDGIDPQFLASLPLEIRDEIIQQYSMPIAQTTQQQFTEVNLAQDQILNNDRNRQQQHLRVQDIISPVYNVQVNIPNLYNRPNPQFLNYTTFFNEQRQTIQDQQIQLKKPHLKSQNLKYLLSTQRHIIQKLGTVEDEFTESLVSLLYVESHSFINFPINLFISLCNIQNVEYKLIDTLFQILKTNQSKEQQTKSFPPQFMVKRNGLVRDFTKIYNVVSLKVLYLFSKLQSSSINYFLENKKENQQNQSSSENSLSFPLLQLIQLLPEFQGDHQELLIQAITNISTKQKDQNQFKVKLDQKSVECICKTLLQNVSKSVKNFSNIIQSLCNNEENQLLIVQYIKEYIDKSIKEINEKFKKSDEIFNGDKALINIFQFVRDINLKVGENNNPQDLSINFKELLESQELIELWKNMIKFLQEIPQQQIIKMTPKISPYLECFFIIYQIVNPIQKNQLNLKESKKIALMEGQYQEVKEQQLHDELFQQICESGKPLLNMMLKERLQEYKEKGKITNDSLGIIILKNPRIVDFENKQKYFKIQLKQLKIQNNKHHYGNITVRCRRKDIFMDSYHRFSKLRPEDLKGKLSVEFDGEEGIDQGGVTREWFLMLSKEIFNPNYALFTPSLNGQMFQPSNKSHVNPDHVKYFKFIGRIVGKALYDGQLLDTYFTRSFYKHILGQKLTIHDMEDIDLNEYKSMKKILEENVNDWGIYWTYTVDNFGRLEERELVEGGRQKQVTEDNKFEYVQTYCYQKMAKEIKDQIEAFLNGFHELIPQNLISIFEWKEMELMLCGLPDIDLEDMKENVEYHGYIREDKVIQWLWELLESFDESKRAAFLQFITGTSKVPLGGFKDLKGIHGSQKIQIHKKHYINYELPTSHTCFNQLDLPCYPTRQVLKEKLELAILEGKEGFGFA